VGEISQLTNEEQAAKVEAHEQRRCTPCAYFAYKADGCRLAENCEYCHLCERGELQRRRKERKQAMRELKLQACKLEALAVECRVAASNVQGRGGRLPQQK